DAGKRASQFGDYQRQRDVDAEPRERIVRGAASWRRSGADALLDDSVRLPGGCIDGPERRQLVGVWPIREIPSVERDRTWTVGDDGSQLPVGLPADGSVRQRQRVLRGRAGDVSVLHVDPDCQERGHLHQWLRDGNMPDIGPGQSPGYSASGGNQLGWNDFRGGPGVQQLPAYGQSHSRGNGDVGDPIADG